MTVVAPVGARPSQHGDAIEMRLTSNSVAPSLHRSHVNAALDLIMRAQDDTEMCLFDLLIEEDTTGLDFDTYLHWRKMYGASLQNPDEAAGLHIEGFDPHNDCEWVNEINGGLYVGDDAPGELNYYTGWQITALDSVSVNTKNELAIAEHLDSDSPYRTCRACIRNVFDFKNVWREHSSRGSVLIMLYPSDTIGISREIFNSLLRQWPATGKKKTYNGENSSNNTSPRNPAQHNAALARPSINHLGNGDRFSEYNPLRFERGHPCRDGKSEVCITSLREALDLQQAEIDGNLEIINSVPTSRILPENMCWHPHNRHIAIFTSSGIYCVDASKHKVVWHQPRYRRPEYAPCWMPYGDRLLAFDFRNRPVALRLKDGLPCPRWVCDVTFDTSLWTNEESWEWNPDGHTALAYHSDIGRVVLLDARNGLVRKNLLENYPGGQDCCKYEAFVWQAPEGMAIQMVDFGDREWLRWYAFDCQLCDISQSMTNYTISDWLSHVCADDDIDRATNLIMEAPHLGTACLPRYGLNVVWILCLMGDAARLRHLAAHCPKMKRMFAVPVAVAMEDNNHKKKKVAANRWQPREKPLYTTDNGVPFVWKYPIDIVLERRHEDVTQVLVEWMATRRGMFIPSVDMTLIGIELVKQNSTYLRAYLEAFFAPTKWSQREHQEKSVRHAKHTSDKARVQRYFHSHNKGLTEQISDFFETTASYIPFFNQGADDDSDDEVCNYTAGPLLPTVEHITYVDAQVVCKSMLGKTDNMTPGLLKQATAKEGKNRSSGIARTSVLGQMKSFRDSVGSVSVTDQDMILKAL